MDHARRLAALAVAVPALLAAAEPGVCTGEGNPFVAAPGFGAMHPLPAGEAAALTRREGAALLLRAENAEIRLEDTPACLRGPDEPDCVRHRLVAAFADPPGFLVERGQYEHVDFLWVHRATGQVESLADLPRLSPGGRWMLSVSTSDYMGLNGIELFDLGRGDIRRAFQHLPSQGDAFDFFSFWRWTKEEEALLCAWRGSPPAMTGPEQVVLRRGPYGWRIETLD
ncbi:hypothetical protein [Falsiroseomonas sp. CW058]|uniref:hypothetical protein n=1 Tax=Falsiroseomonas sp. CW058 TaxID=3388664 RepID=UPI003D319864